MTASTPETSIREPEQIISRSDLFRGELVDKPLVAIVVGEDDDGNEIVRCPHCGNIASTEQCGIGGAEPDCLFCNQCNREFEIP